MNFTKQCLKYGRSKLHALIHLNAFAYFFLVQSAGVTLNTKVFPGIEKIDILQLTFLFSGEKHLWTFDLLPAGEETNDPTEFGLRRRCHLHLKGRSHGFSDQRMDGKDQSASFQESIGQFTCDIIPYQHSFFIVTEMYAEVFPFPSNITSNPVLWMSGYHGELQSDIKQEWSRRWKP